MEVRQRKALGCFALLAYLALYLAIAGTIGAVWAITWPAWAQLLYFLVAGIVWIAPLKPLFGWMNGAR